MPIVDDRPQPVKQLFGAMAIGQAFKGGDGKFYRKLDNTPDKNCWNLNDNIWQVADPASAEQFEIVDTVTHITA